MTQSNSPGTPRGADGSAPGRGARQAVVAVIVAVLALGVILGIKALGAGALGTGDTAGVEAPVMPVATRALEFRSAYEVERRFVGVVEARRTSEVGFELSGRVRAMAADEGDVVETGGALARLDTDRLRARRAEVEAQLSQASADLDLAEATLARVSEAAGVRAVSTQELDEARESRNAAAARRRLAEAQLRSIDVDLAKSVLRAPYKAVVVARRVDEGQVVEAGRPVLRLQEFAAREIRVGVAGAQARALAVGAEQAIEHEGRRLVARVRAVLPTRDPNGRTVDVLLDVSPEDAPALRPGDLVDVPIAVRLSAEGTWLPLSALHEGPRGLWAVYATAPLPEDALARARGATHRLARRTVEVLHQTESQAYVRGTLAPGDRVVLDGLQRVVPGQGVTLVGDQARGAGG